MPRRRLPARVPGPRYTDPDCAHDGFRGDCEGVRIFRVEAGVRFSDLVRRMARSISRPFNLLMSRNARSDDSRGTSAQDRRMTLRQKTLLMVGGTLTVLIGILYVVSREVLLRGFGKLEEQLMQRDTQRGIDALQNELADLHDKAGDWANWDDAYAYIEDESPAFVASNLQDTTFIDLRLNLLMLIKTSGRVVYGKAIDHDQKVEVPIPAALATGFSSGFLSLPSAAGLKDVSGIVMLPEGPLLLTARPIRTSAGDSPSRGLVVMGRYLNEKTLQHLSDLTHLTLTTWRLDEAELPTEAREAAATLSKDGAICVHPRDADSIVGHTLLRDLGGVPVLALQVETTRDVYREGQLSARSLMLAALIVGLVLGALTLGLIEWFVLARVARLSTDVTRIGSGGDLSTRVSLPGTDELAQLAGAINALLEAIEQGDMTLREGQRALTALMSNLPGMAYRCRNDADWSMEFASEGCKELTGYEPADLIEGRTVSYNQLIHPADDERISNEVQGALRARQPFRLTYRITTATGQEKWVWEQGRGILSARGDLVGYEGFISDITDRKLAEERLQLTQFSIDWASGSVYWIDAGGRLVYVNEAACRKLGYTREELLRLTIADIDPDFPSESWPQHWQHLKELGALQFESRHRGKDGRVFPVEVSANYQEFAGKAYNFAFTRDITERKRADETLRTHAAALRGCELRVGCPKATAPRPTTGTGGGQL